MNDPYVYVVFWPYSGATPGLTGFLEVHPLAATIGSLHSMQPAGSSHLHHTAASSPSVRSHCGAHSMRPSVATAPCSRPVVDEFLELVCQHHENCCSLRTPVCLTACPLLGVDSNQRRLLSQPVSSKLCISFEYLQDYDPATDGPPPLSKLYSPVPTFSSLALSLRIRASLLAVALPYGDYAHMFFRTMESVSFLMAVVRVHMIWLNFEYCHFIIFPLLQADFHSISQERHLSASSSLKPAASPSSLLPSNG